MTSIPLGVMNGPTRKEFSMQNNLKQKSREELILIWQELFKLDPPADLNKSYLIKHIDWQQKYGGLDVRTQKQLDKLAAQYEKTKELKSSDIKKVARFEITQGTKLLRDFKGQKHEVIALEKGFGYKGKPYKSLSAIANEITGTRWNGKKFFGVAS